MENKRQEKIIFTGYALRILLFPLRAISTTTITTTKMVFAQPVSQADRVSVKLKSVKIQANA
jgi:hypothetical protein|nr:MAG TPA: hypothetical protein [Herelleviridae sp.]DAV56905.1 MAG TPA: hypothetical protein [Caudoviricetes sp.]